MKKFIVVCVGFQKTGTSTIEAVLSEFGYTVAGYDPNLVHLLGKNSNLPDSIKNFNAFQDNPWPLLYKDFDENFDNCKFILTTRNSSDWIRSVTNHFGHEETAMRKALYGHGSPIGNEKAYIKRYEEHNHAVLDYFKGRDRDFLHLRLSENTNWDDLCLFLEEPLPPKPFPHVNRGTYNRIKKLKIYKNLRKIIK